MKKAKSKTAPDWAPLCYEGSLKMEARATEPALAIWQPRNELCERRRTEIALGPPRISPAVDRTRIRRPKGSKNSGKKSVNR